jgi:multidrug resistance efflux pump
MIRLHKLLAISTKKRIFILILLAIFGAGGRWSYQHFFSSKTTEDEYFSNDMMVTTGDIVNALTMNGKAQFSSTQKLTFQNAGRIIAVYKKVGDLVKEGDVIAKMDTYEIDNELEQARIDLENEQRALEKAQNTSKKELEILQAEKKYQALLYEQENSGTSLKLALQAIENEYVNKKNEYEKLLSDYKKKQDEYDTKQKTYDEIVTLDKSNQILYSDEALKERVETLKYSADGVQKELNSLDKVMLYTTKYGTTKPEYYIYVGAKDQSTKSTVERLFREVSTLASAVYDWTNNTSTLTLSEVSLKSQLIQQYEKMKELAEKKTELSNAVIKMFEANIESEGTNIPSVTITDGRTLKSEANTAIDEIL